MTQVSVLIRFIILMSFDTSGSSVRLFVDVVLLSTRKREHNKRTSLECWLSKESMYSVLPTTMAYYDIGGGWTGLVAWCRNTDFTAPQFTATVGVVFVLLELLTANSRQWTC